MIRDFQIQALEYWDKVKSLGLDDIIYKPQCLFQDRSPYIYLFLNIENNVIYVGQTQNISDRMFKHIKESDFWTEVAHILYAEAPSLNLLTNYERYYIQRFSPRYNKKGFKIPHGLSPDAPMLNFYEYKGKEVLNYGK